MSILLSEKIKPIMITFYISNMQQLNIVSTFLTGKNGD